MNSVDVFYSGMLEVKEKTKDSLGMMTHRDPNNLASDIKISTESANSGRKKKIYHFTLVNLSV